MSALSLLLSWVGIILLTLLIMVGVVLRVVRYYIHFPAPLFAVKFLDNPVRRLIQSPRKVIEWADIREGMCVLEVGPGPGTFTKEAAARVGKGHVFAVDIQPGVITSLNERLQKEHITNVTTKVASAYELPFQDKTFDRIFMVTVLAEIPDRMKALREFRRVLKDDGILATGEFVIDPDYPRQKTEVKWGKEAGFDLVGARGGIFHYVVTFKKGS